MWSRGHRPKRAEAARVSRRELKKASDKLLLPHDVTDEASCIYTRSLKTGLAKGRPLLQIAASSLYAACRERNIPTTLDDVAAASGVNKIVVARAYRLLVTALDLKIPVADPAECLAMVASRAKVHPKVEADALEILSKAEKAGITAGLYPTGLAAAALYLASLLNGESLTQVEAAEAAGVKDVTVRKQYKRLGKVLKVHLGRTPRTKRRSWSELEASTSMRVEVPLRSPA